MAELAKANRPEDSERKNDDDIEQEKEKDGEYKLSHADASHYLVLADGRHVPHQVGDNPYATFPSEYDGVRVTGAVSAH